MRKHSAFCILYSVFYIIGGFFIFLSPVQAAVLGEQVNFYVDSFYDLTHRSQVAAVLRTIGNNIYFYVETDYWNKLDEAKKALFQQSLNDLANEFDNVIYPKERAVFGSEWSPGIDNDKRISVLATQLKSEAGGYINVYDEYLQTESPSSNQREMIYLNTTRIIDPKNKAFLAHEFQHLITFYQKTILFGKEEDVWLNEARSEYAVTLCGYNDIYLNSYLSTRVDTFLLQPSDSLSEWQNNEGDYGTANLFIHYLVDRYGPQILTRMTLNDKVGIDSIEQALTDLGKTEKFSDIFADWSIANYLNNCQVAPANKYCYLNKNLTYERLHLGYTASYSGFPNLIISRSGAVKDWSAHWYQFRQGLAVPTERDTLKLDFIGSNNNGDFLVPYIITDQNNQTTVQFIPLSNQNGSAYIPNFTSQNKSVVMIPFNQYKKSGFSDNEPLTGFSFTAASVSGLPPVIRGISPESGSKNGGIEATIRGENLSSVVRITLAGNAVSVFNIISDSEIKFIVPASSVDGPADLVLINKDGLYASLVRGFTYKALYPDGSLIRASGDYKVYVVKGSYRRWIQSQEIFKFYPHFNWQSVIEVAPVERDSYQEAWLIRAANDFRVYEVNADRTKHWLNMTAEEFSQSGRQWDMVYIVNSSERDFYRTGAEVFYR